MTFAEQLRLFRARAGVSQADLAGAVGLSHSHLNKVQTGRRPPPKRMTVARISEALGLSDADSTELLSSAGYSPVPPSNTAAVRYVRRVATDESQIPPDPKGIFGSLARLYQGELSASAAVLIDEALGDLSARVIRLAIELSQLDEG